MTLFSEHVLPELKAIETKSTQAAPFAEVEQSRLTAATSAAV